MSYTPDRHRTNALTLAALTGTVLAAGCAQPTREVVFVNETTPQIEPQHFDDSDFASFQGRSTGFGRVDAFEAATMEAEWSSDRSPRAGRIGRAGTATELDLYGNVVGQSLPTEVDFHGQSPDIANRTQVTSTHEGSDFDPVVTRDGSRMLFASTQHRPTADIYSRPVDSQVVTQLTQHPANDAMPAPSPDGNRVAFCSDRNGNWDIFVMPITGGPAVQITSEGSHELHPSWSPDGQQLVFSRLGEVSGRWELWTVDLNNTGIAHFIGFGLFPEWCPVSGTGENGADKIVFQRARERGERAFSVWTVDYKNGVARNQSQVASSGQSALINPTWSPDGRWIAYASVPNPSEWADFSDAQPEHAALHMCDAFGQGRVALTGDGFVDLMPSWSNDNEIFFVSNRTGGENIWAVNAGDAIRAASGDFTPPVPGNDFANFTDNQFRAPTSEPTPEFDEFANVPTPDYDD